MTTSANDELMRLADEGVTCALLKLDDERLNALPRDLLVQFVAEAASAQFVAYFARQVMEMSQAGRHGSQ